MLNTVIANIAFHSPSPSALMPVLSISRCNGPVEPLYGMATNSVFCRRHKVLKSGTEQSSPTSSSRLATKPVVCITGRPNKTLSVSQACIPHRCRIGGALVDRKAQSPMSSQDQTRSTVIRVVSRKDYTLSSFGSCMPSVSSWSLPPVITLD